MIIVQDNRGQAYTLEGVIGAIIIASALVLGLQAVSIAPWADDSVDRRSDALRTQVEDVLSSASDRDALVTAATCIAGDGDGEPHEAVADGEASNDSQRDEFGVLLNRSLSANSHQFTVELEYLNVSDGSDVNTTLLTRDRDVTGASVTVTRQVVLFDTDPVMRFDTNRGVCRPVVAANDTLQTWRADPDRDIYLTDSDDDSDIYAVVKFRVVAW